MTDLWEAVQPALIAALELVAAVAIGQFALYLRRKHQFEKVHALNGLVQSLADDAVAYAEQISNARGSMEREMAAFEKMDTALLYARRQSLKRGLGNVDAEEMRDRIETSLGRVRMDMPLSVEEEEESE